MSVFPIDYPFSPARKINDTDWNKVVDNLTGSQIKSGSLTINTGPTTTALNVSGISSLNALNLSGSINSTTGSIGINPSVYTTGSLTAGNILVNNGLIVGAGNQVNLTPTLSSIATQFAFGTNTSNSSLSGQVQIGGSPTLPPLTNYALNIQTGSLVIVTGSAIINGNEFVSGSLAVGNNETINNNVTIGGNLIVSGSISGSLNIGPFTQSGSNIILQSGSNITLQSGSIVPFALPASYVVFSGSVIGYNATYFAVNGKTNRIDYSGTDAAVVISGSTNALSSSGGTIFVKAGIYILTNQILIPSNITLKGEGIGKTIFRLAAGTGNLLQNPNDGWFRNFDYTNGNTDILLEDFEIDGNRSNRTRSYSANDDSNIEFDANLYGNGPNYNQRIFINRVNSHDSNGHGIHFRYCRDSIVTNCVTTNNGRAATDGFWHGVYFMKCIDSFIRGCRSDSQIDKSGFKINVCHRVIISDSIANYNPVNGIEGGDQVGLPQEDITILGCTFIGNGTYIPQTGSNAIDFNVNYSKRINIIGNIISGSGENGIVLNNITGSVISNNIIFNNSQQSSGWQGIRIASSRDITISNNICRDDQTNRTQGAGIYILGGCSYITLNGNVLSGNTGSGGIYVENTKKLDINGCVSENNLGAGSQGISIYNIDQFTINNCVMTENGSNGLVISNSKNGSISNNIIMNNSVSVIGWQGIRCSSGSDIIINNNRCGDNQIVKTQAYGIYLVDTGSNIIVSNNNLNGNITSGFLSDGVSNSIVSGNLL